MLDCHASFLDLKIVKCPMGSHSQHLFHWRRPGKSNGARHFAPQRGVSDNSAPCGIYASLMFAPPSFLRKLRLLLFCSQPNSFPTNGSRVLFVEPRAAAGLVPEDLSSRITWLQKVFVSVHLNCLPRFLSLRISHLEQFLWKIGEACNLFEQKINQDGRNDF